MGFSRVPLERIVRVVVQTKDGKEQGTGFRFSADRVVTSFHVIEGADEIRVLDPDSEGGWIDSGDLDSAAGHGVLWPVRGSEASLDAAVLGTPEVEGLSSGSFLGNPWSSRTAWEGYGFPASEAEVRKGFSGHAFPIRAGDPSCELAVADTKIRQVRAWGGLSGAPIFLEISGAFFFAGVIRDSPEDTEGSRLWATPLPTLLEDREFRLALLGDEPDWFEDYVDLVREKLQGDESANTTVRLALGMTGEEEVAQEVVQAAAHRVEVREVCLALAKAAKNLDRDGNHRSGDRVREILSAVAPVRFLRSMGLTPPSSEARRIDLEVASELGADAVVAAILRRSMEVKEIPGDVPEPKWRVSKPGVFGIDLDGADASRDVVEEVRKLVELTPGPECAARAYLIHLAKDLGLFPAKLRRQIAGLDTSHESWEKVVSQAIDRRLRTLSDVERLYFLMELKEDSEQQEQFLRRLGSDLPALRLVTTSKSSDPDQLNMEDEILQTPFEHAYSGETPEDDTE